MSGPIIRRRRRRLGLLNRADRILLAVMAVGGAAGLFAQAFSYAEGGIIAIRGEDGFEEFVQLGGDGRFAVPGPVGETVIVVQGGVAFVESSDCRHQICVNSGYVNEPGEFIVCVPNGVMVVVEGVRKADFDAITR